MQTSESPAYLLPDEILKAGHASVLAAHKEEARTQADADLTPYSQPHHPPNILT